MDTKDNEIKNENLTPEASNDNHTESSSTTNTTAEKEPTPSHNTNEPQPKRTFGRRVVNILKKNILAIVLFLALIIVFIWLTAKNANQEKQFIQEKTELTSTYESKIDKLKINNIKFASEVFSWSVRSELLRNNVENLNQLVSIFVKKSDVSLVQIVDIEKKQIILSSDKKYEGIPYTGNLDVSDTETVVKNSEDGKSQIITPIMGFNSKIGLLIVTL